MKIPTTRADLARLVPPDGLMIELGVAAGAFAWQLLTQNPAMIYVGVDRWSDHHDEAEMRVASYRLGKWAARASFIRASFEAAISKIAEESADLIYIDGYAHTGQEGGQTLRDWWPKLKPGGIFAGHDYDVDHYPQTVCAVNDFITDMDRQGIRLKLNVIDEKPHPSWWLVKPET